MYNGFILDKYIFLDNICRLLAESVENNRYASIPPRAAKLLLEFVCLHKNKWENDLLKSLTQLAREYAKEQGISYKKAYRFCWIYYHNGSYKTIKMNNRVFVILEKPKETEDEPLGETLDETFSDIFKEIKSQGLTPTSLLLMKGFGLSKANAGVFMEWYMGKI